MTTTEHERGRAERSGDERSGDEPDLDERGRDGRGADAHRRDDRGRDGDDRGGGPPVLRSSRGRRPTRVDVVAGLALVGLVAALDLPSSGTVAASALAVVTGALVRVDIAQRRLPNVLVLVVLVGTAAGVAVGVGAGDGAPAAGVPPRPRRAR